MGEPTISFVLASQNRRDVVLDTLERLRWLEPTVASEIILVVNPSQDGTAEAVGRRLTEVQVLTLEENLGACAKNRAVPQARGRFIVFLDDDSCPRPGSIKRMIEHFDADATLGGAGFVAHLPNGGRECSALPHVFIGCGVGFRREALQAVGGLDESFFMAAEEYDLCFRLATAGWKTRNFVDLQVDHLKSTVGRSSRRLSYFDTRNNLRLIARYLPNEWIGPYWQDWSNRYRWIAAINRTRIPYWKGRLQGTVEFARQRRSYKKWQMPPTSFESFFQIERIHQHMRELVGNGVGNIVLADLGKNIYPFVRAATECGICIRAIGDDFFARATRQYRSIPVLSVEKALACQPAAVVIANCSPVHAENTQQRWQAVTAIPIHRWFGYDRSEND